MVRSPRHRPSRLQVFRNLQEEQECVRSTPMKGATRAAQGTDPREVVIGVGAAFQKEIKINKTMGGIPLDEVLRNVKAGIEEEGMTSRVVKVLDTSDVCFMALQAAKLSGSGIGIGIQSKGTTVIHQKRSVSSFQSGTFPSGASHGPG